MIEGAQALSNVDSSTTSGVEHEQILQAEKPVNQEAVNKRFNKLSAEKYEYKAQAEKFEKENEELRKMQPPSQALAGAEQSTPPQVLKPPSQDLFYEDETEFNRQNTAYQEQLTRKIFAEQQETANEAEKQRLETERNQQQQTQRQVSVEESAKTHNIDINELNNSAIILNQRGTNPSFGEMLLAHENSAPLIDYLAKNPGDFDQINQLTDPFSILRSLDSLQSKAVQRNISNTPDPVTGLKGLPAREGDDFDKRFPDAEFK